MGSSCGLDAGRPAGPALSPHLLAAAPLAWIRWQMAGARVWAALLRPMLILTDGLMPYSGPLLQTVAPSAIVG